MSFGRFLLVILMGQVAVAFDTFPQILTQTSNQTRNFSSNAILTCHIRDLGDHHVTWLKVDPTTSLSQPLAVGQELFTIDSRFSISSYSTSSRESFWSLEIYQLTLADEGTYLCQIANRRASVSIAIHLHVQIVMHLSPTYLYVEPNHPAQLNCSLLIGHQANHSSPVTIQWHFLSKQMNKSRPQDIHIRKRWINQMFVSYLAIPRAQTHHTGIWTCIYKRQRRTTRLIVEKDVVRRQRTSALLTNRSTRMDCSSSSSSSSLVFFSLQLIIHLFALTNSTVR